jgi:hypothetical protein
MSFAGSQLRQLGGAGGQGKEEVNLFHRLATCSGLLCYLGRLFLLRREQNIRKLS